ncbi:MAG: glycosyltransferase family 4 protein [Flavobacteriales bacterium]|nr:glycosyltransferase family 4 protein [Flavobacteriales bacterium]
MAKQKLMHVLYSGIGGHGNVFKNFVEADVNKQYNYSALFYGIEPMRDSYEAFCIENDIVYSYCNKNIGVDLLFYFRILLAIIKQKPDVIFLHGSYLIFPCFLFSKFKKCKVLVRETQANHLKTKIDFLMLKWALQWADHVVFLTEEFKKEVVKRYALKNIKPKISVIPNGIDLNTLDQNRDYLKEATLACMVSRIVSIKDFFTLVSAFELLQKKGSPLQLKIAGKGALEDELKKLIADKEIRNIQFVGELNESQIFSLLNASDMYIHPTFGETMSTSLMQAMGAGLPIISSNVDGVKNMIDHGKTGLLVKTEAIEELVAAIENICSSPTLRSQLGKAAYQVSIKKFDRIKMFDAYSQLIQPS